MCVFTCAVVVCSVSQQLVCACWTGSCHQSDRRLVQEQLKIIHRHTPLIACGGQVQRSAAGRGQRSPCAGPVCGPVPASAESSGPSGIQPAEIRGQGLAPR